jgi:hypothetical protein
MNQWKLVPEAIDECAKPDVWNSAYAAGWNDCRKRMLAAATAPDVQPVAWQYEKNDGKLCVSVHPPEAIEQWNDNIKWSKPLYTHPTSKDVHELLEALRLTIEAIASHDDSKLIDVAMPKARSTLAKWDKK